MADRTHTPERDRLITLDALRGFALLGILVPNIYTFAWPVASMFDHATMGDTAWNASALTIMQTVFLGKFMFLFAMLFGAGAVLFDRKTRSSGRPKLTDGWALWHRRCAVLLGFGLIHAYLFWYGDILTWYAFAGLTLVWWIRRLPIGVQIWGGLAAYTLGFLLMGLFMAVGLYFVETGKMPVEQLMGDPAGELAGYRGSFADAFRTRFFQTAKFQLLYGPLFLPALWGTMALGMGLTRAGILTGERSTKFHATFGISMLVVGAMLTAIGYLACYSLDLVTPPAFVWQAFAQFLGIPLSLGYSQLVVLACRSHRMRGPVKGLANVGRMALSNYLSHTLICTTIFYGYGLGRFGTIDFPALFGIVLAVWIFNFAFSALWLRFFPYGPFEWLWRQVTYLGFRAV